MKESRPPVRPCPRSIEVRPDPGWFAAKLANEVLTGQQKA